MDLLQGNGDLCCPWMDSLILDCRVFVAKLKWNISISLLKKNDKFMYISGEFSCNSHAVSQGAGMLEDYLAASRGEGWSVAAAR